MSEYPSLNGRVALVTGANRGLGLAVARAVAQCGARVLLAARDPAAAAAAVVTALSGTSLAIEAVTLDVANDASVAALAAREPRVDVLINNAGVLEDQDVPGLEVGLDRVRHAFEVHAVGALHLIQRFAPGMRSRGWGRIVNVSSDWGSLAHMESHHLAYRMSKTALNAVTRSLAHELRGTGVLVNALNPGWVRTRMGGATATLTPEQAAGTVMWLATLPKDGPSGEFFNSRREPLAW
ncbi:MAG: SDR family NAD(P)-dependent oxidoreductase [Candidatus Eisenbacteria bacterium]|uniref:SDR family NAD(P)-dependent oxidoreductase n=1 Tax=Eiseniibacteriota bacterium TaxID=2212470 RepID=A0A849SIX6_UNCEI|nr:SDR family NAD(P)-dependent oxidoreductase [Candidatus Eisenbacteria bacterium]